MSFPLIYNNYIMGDIFMNKNLIKRSLLWTISKEDLQKLVSQSQTYSAILVCLGLCSKGSGNHHRLKQRIEEEGIDCSHIKGGRQNNLGRKFRRDWIPLDKILVKNSAYTNRQRLKLRLVKERLLVYKCAICGLIDEWMGKSLGLQLDHINGIFNDNRLENLRFLCPNCHSQSGTFAGKNKKKKKKK
jgi:5-methylcytosine-specific restriction endonuclease McrA